MSTSPGGFLPPLDPQQQNGNPMTRVMLTASLMLMAWMGLNALNPPKPIEEKKPDAPVAAATTGSGAAAIGAAPTDGVVSTADSLPEQTHTVKVDVAAKDQNPKIMGGFEGAASSYGAQISSWQLTGYFEAKLEKGQDTTKLPRVDIAKANNDGARLLALRSRGGDVALKADAPYEVTAKDDSSITFERLTPSGVRVTRRYVFDDAHFAVKLDTTLKNESQDKRTAELDMVLVGKERPGERDEGGMFAVATDKLGGACVMHNDRETFFSKAVDDDPDDFRFKGPVRSAAIDRHYFVGAVTFDAVPTDGCTASPFKRGTGKEIEQGIEIAVSLTPIPLAPGEVKSFAQEAFLGPKQIDALKAFGHGQEESIDFGMLAVLSRPLLWLMVAIEAQTHDYGLAIIGLTLCIFFVTLPLTHRSMVEMKKFGKVMKDLKPELDKIKDKYGHDQRLMVEKQQAFFQEKGVNPFANLMGCLPMLISMPVWIALYRTLSTAVELYQQPFQYLPGVLDLTQADTILFGWPLLPFIVCALMLVSTLQQPPPEDQPQMKYVMYGMPVFFLFIMFSMASGLSIYMITNSLLRMAQSHYIKRKHG